jgi:hypothetical protein
MPPKGQARRDWSQECPLFDHTNTIDPVAASVTGRHARSSAGRFIDDE